MQKFAPSLLAVGLAAALVGCQESGPQGAGKGRGAREGAGGGDGADGRA